MVKVSIITATYNCSETIAACLQSIHSQTYSDIEHIVVDGESTDDTLQIIQKESRECIIISEPDEGLYDALNKGISMASGDVIGFLHADDVFTSREIIEEIVSGFIEPETIGVYGDLEYIRKNGSVLRYWKSGVFSKKMITEGWMPPHPTLFLKKELYSELGVFNTDFKISADYDFVLRLLSAPNTVLKYIPRSLVRMRTGGVSNRSIKNILRKSTEDFHALKQNNIQLPLLVLFKKNFSKIGQFFYST